MDFLALWLLVSVALAPAIGACIHAGGAGF